MRFVDCRGLPTTPTCRRCQRDTVIQRASSCLDTSISSPAALVPYRLRGVIRPRFDLMSALYIAFCMQQVIAPGAARRYAAHRWQFDPKIAADLRPSADGSAVRTLCPRPRGNLGIARSVRLPVPRRSCLCYRHAGCL